MNEEAIKKLQKELDEECLKTYQWLWKYTTIPGLVKLVIKKIKKLLWRK